MLDLVKIKRSSSSPGFASSLAIQNADLSVTDGGRLVIFFSFLSVRLIKILLSRVECLAPRQRMFAHMLCTRSFLEMSWQGSSSSESSVMDVWTLHLQTRSPTASINLLCL